MQQTWSPNISMISFQTTEPSQKMINSLEFMSKDLLTFKVLDQALGGWTYVVWAIFFSNRNLNLERFIFLGTNDRKPWLQTIKIRKHSRNCIKSQDYNERLHEKFMKIVLGIPTMMMHSHSKKHRFGRLT
jgi:hypothetical protein